MPVTCLLRRGLAAIVLCLLACPAAAGASLTRLADIATPPVPSFCPGPLAVTPDALDVVDGCGDAGRILRFSRDGQTYVTTLGPQIKTSPTITLGSLRGLAADPATGARYVSDTRNGRLVRLTSAGAGTAQIPGIDSEGAFSVPGPLGPGYCTDLGYSECFPPTGTAPGRFDGPADIALDTSSVLVIDTGNHRVQRFTPDLQTVLGTFGDASVLPNPTAVAVDPVSGQVFVANSQGIEEPGPANIIVFSASGAKVGEIPSSGYVDALAVDREARVLFAMRDTSPPGGSVATYDLATRSLLRSEGLAGAVAIYEAALDPGARVLTLTVFAGQGPVGWRFSYSPPPVCQPSEVTISPGATAAIAAACADPDAPALTYAVPFPPEHGTLSGFDPATGTATYTPDPGFTGTDTVGLAARSLNGTSTPVDATITVAAPPEPPAPSPGVRAADTPACPAPMLATGYEKPLGGQLACGSGAYSVVSPPANGTLSAIGADGTFTYTPNARFAGEDRFTYTVTTAAGTSVATTVTIRVGQALPAPEAKETANVQRATGTIKYRVGGKGPWITLVAGAQIPLGSEIDAREGRVGVFVIGANGQPQSADFFGGIFVLDQQGSPLSTWLALTGSGLPQASTRAVAAGGPVASAAGKKKRKPKRRLWGDGKGDFRTAGNGSSASVRGTKWLVEDYSDGTLTKVARGVVVVRDRCKKRTVTLRKGQQYFARLPKGRKRC